MPIIPFNNNIGDIKAFGHDVTKVMAFGHQVWQKSIPVTIKAQEVYLGTDFTNIVGTITDPLGTTQSFSQGTTVSVRPTVQYTIDITSISTGSGNEPVLYNSQFTFTLGGNTDNYYFAGDVLFVECKYASRIVINLYDYSNSQQLPSTTQVKYDVYVGTTPVMQDVVVDNGYIIHLKSVLDQISTLAGTTINTIGLKVTGILDANSQPITGFESIDNTQWLTLNNDYSITLTGDNFTLSPTSFANNGTIININLFIPDYLCFTALEAGQFTLTIPAALSTNDYSRLSYIEWSKDGRNWNRTENKNSTEITIPVDVVTGDNVYWRGSGTSMTSASVALTSDCRFTSTARFNASGHLLSLLKLDDYDATTGWASASFANLFYQATTLIDASGIILPALAAGNAYTFYGTFYECTNLVAAPDFNTSYTGNFMCFQMYRGCTSLTTMPKLPTTLSTSIFSGMFRGCTSLAITQPLNYSTLAENCFANMFNGCSSLSYVKCLATDISANGCLTNWLSGVSSTGTFIQASGVSWPRSASGIPAGWVVIEKRTMPQGYKQVEYLSNPNYGYININRAFESNAEKLEIAFVKQGSGGSMPFGNSTYNYRYGQLKVIGQSTALAIRAGVDYDDQVYKQSQITSVTDDKPHTLQYVGSSSGFQLYLDGTLKKTETCAWDAVNPFDGNMLFTASTNTSSTAYFHVKPIYYLKIWDSNNTLAVDYVACVRESDNVAGFYDMVGGVFHPSDNANNFTAGQEI